MSGKSEDPRRAYELPSALRLGDACAGAGACEPGTGDVRLRSAWQRCQHHLYEHGGKRHQ